MKAITIFCLLFQVKNSEVIGLYVIEYVFQQSIIDYYQKKEEKGGEEEEEEIFKDLKEKNFKNVLS